MLNVTKTVFTVSFRIDHIFPEKNKNKIKFCSHSSILSLANRRIISACLCPSIQKELNRDKNGFNILAKVLKKGLAVIFG